MVQGPIAVCTGLEMCKMSEKTGNEREEVDFTGKRIRHHSTSSAGSFCRRSYAKRAVTFASPPRKSESQ
jgi:hypothetical protein